MALVLKGKLEKLVWKDIRSEVQAVNPELAKIIDELNPSSKHWLTKVTYPYGAEVMKRSLLMLPNRQGDLVPIADSSIDSELREGLSYNLNSNPVSLVLKNSFEIFLPLDDRTIPMTGLIYQGAAFGASHILRTGKIKQPAFIWDMTAGARTTFLLPKITEVKKHKNILKNIGFAVPVPKSTLQHWEIFRQIANSGSLENKWCAEILFFSKSWFDHLSDLHWKNFYNFFQKSTWGQSDITVHIIWNLIFSLILKNYEITPSAYIVDTVKYLLYMGIGAYTGLAPARNDNGGPFSLIQNIYENIYGLKNYAPTIMQPCSFNPENTASFPVYYSLQHPIAFEFKQNARSRASIISDLHDILNLMNRFQRELISDKYNVSQTALGDIFNFTQYDYFHNNVDLHAGMRDSENIFREDKSFLTTISGKKYKEYPSKCSFIRGCVKLSNKNIKIK